MQFCQKKKQNENIKKNTRRSNAYTRDFTHKLRGVYGKTTDYFGGDL